MANTPVLVNILFDLKDLGFLKVMLVGNSALAKRTRVGASVKAWLAVSMDTIREGIVCVCHSYRVYM